MQMLDAILGRMLGAADAEIPPSVRIAWRMGIGATDSPETFSVAAMTAQTLGQPMPAAEKLGEQGTPAQEATRVMGDSGRRFVNIAEVMDDKRERFGETLDWRHSIADLLTLLDLDASVAARRQLARELGYPGDATDHTGDHPGNHAATDQGAMDAWLHRTVMQKAAEQGGEVPAELLR
jgi:hypothetical protein